MTDCGSASRLFAGFLATATYPAYAYMLYRIPATAASVPNSRGTQYAARDNAACFAAAASLRIRSSSIATTSGDVPMADIIFLHKLACTQYRAVGGEKKRGGGERSE